MVMVKQLIDIWLLKLIHINAKFVDELRMKMY